MRARARRIVPVHGQYRGEPACLEPRARAEAIHQLDVGLGPQLKLDYSAKDHKGFDHVIPSVVRSGRPVPFTDWTTVAPK